MRGAGSVTRSSFAVEMGRYPARQIPETCNSAGTLHQEKKLRFA